MTTARTGFPKSARLLSKSEYDAVFKHQKPNKGKFFVVFSRQNGSGEARLGLAISRKCTPIAVRRNRIKRLIRENFRHLRSELDTVDLVFICRKNAGNSTSRELSADLGRLLKRYRTTKR